MPGHLEREAGGTQLDPILSLRGITKIYPGVVALDDVSIDIAPGEIHALIGENGAGKSTLIKTITGAITPDSGAIVFEGEEYSSMTPALSKSLGIEAVYQEFNLAPSASVAENIFMGDRIGGGWLFSGAKVKQAAAKVLKQFDVDVNPSALVSELTVAKKQIVEIAKAVASNARLVIMDEPTAPLTDNEVEVLFEIIRQLKDHGVTIIYISHRLEELFEITDRVTVMRDGKVVETRPTEDFTKASLIVSMVGRTLSESFPPRDIEIGDVVLEARNMSGDGVVDASLQLRRSEILGLAGLVGAGRTELARLIFGADPRSSGQVFMHGEEISIKSPVDALRNRIGLLSEDRKTQGVILRASIKWNESITTLQKLSRFLVINRKEEDKAVSELSERLRVRTPSVEQLVMNLSGGNQQKVALAKWLASQCEVLIFDEPTRGVDVGAKQEIYQLMNDLVAEGLSIIMISSEMEEILGMSDRLLVMSEGRIAGVLEKDDFSQTAVLSLASN